jgi:methylisocitrate lyase
MTPVLPAAKLQEIGYAAVAFAVAATYTVAKSLADLFAALKRDGTTDAARAGMIDFAAFNELVGIGAQRRREAELQDFAERLLAGREETGTPPLKQAASK